SPTLGTKQKIWCDVHTDGGGFALVGMKDSPVSWTVPSNSTPVDPQGPPHWSSDLGDVKVMDFRVQFSTDKGFEGTKADWFYRLNSQRDFGDIFSVNKGCPDLQAGIGNIEFVKDLSTQSVLTNNFKCSKFGPHTHHMLGWGKMNYCLRNPCKNGYAILDVINLQYDNFGAYSYSAVSSFSGMNHNSTAFVGCDHGKCCACFGPKGIAHKGSCSGKRKSFLNEGTLTVSDKESFDKIPDVPGLLSYRKDDKQLYVNQGSKWQALSTEQEFEQTKKQIQSQEKKIQSLENEANIQEMKLQNQEKNILNQKNKTNIQEKKIRNQDNIIQIQGKKIQGQVNKINIQENKLQSQEKKIQSQGKRIRKLEKENQDWHLIINLAQNKPASQSATTHNAPARRAVDGNKNPNFGEYSCTHTPLTNSPWWRVDLQNGVGYSVVTF
ncbi:Hypothetical predicted protein, partial [Paramuricea clavata]